jgi:hypothetical protein
MTLAEQIKQVMDAQESLPAHLQIIFSQHCDIIRQLTDIVRVQHEELEAINQNAYMVIALGTSDKPTSDWVEAIRTKVLRALALSAPIVKEIV